MAKISGKKAEKLSKRSDYFKIEDGETAVVRFPYESIEDLIEESVYGIHEIRSGDTFKRVDCLCGEDDEIDTCPFCEYFTDPKQRVKPQVMMSVYNEDLKMMQIWPRTPNIKKELKKALESQLKSKPLVGALVEITRYGVKLDTEYTFNLVEETVESNGEEFIKKCIDNTKLEDLPERLDPFDVKCIDSLTYKEMKNFIETGAYPKKGDNKKDEAPPPRRSDRISKTKADSF